MVQHYKNTEVYDIVFMWILMLVALFLLHLPGLLRASIRISHTLIQKHNLPLYFQ